MKPATYLKKVGPYTLIREIGHGSFARVYRGKIEGRQEDVAIKMIQKQNVRTESMAIIEKEIEILRQLNHPNIINLIDFKRTQNHYYLVFEFCENGDLDAYIKKYTPNGRLPEDEVRRIVQQLAQALRAMYQLRIVHRDLKLANILVSKNFQIKLADFGFAKFMEDDSYMTTYCGTPLTMAPEILKRDKYNDKCDVWSVGIIIYQMIYGKFPYVPPKGGHVDDLINIINTQPLTFPETEQVSPKLKELLTQMLQNDFKKRINFLDFFNHSWLKIEVLDDYIKSIKHESQEITQEVTQVFTHRLSEDIQDDEQCLYEKDELNETNKDTQLKFIGTQLQKQAFSYLDQMFDDVAKVKSLCEQINSQKMQYQFLQSRMCSLSLSIRIYEALLLQQISEFMKEQVVVLHTQSSNSSLISLQIKKPFSRYQLMLQKEIIDMKSQLKENEQITSQFEHCGYSIADNIFDETMELLMNLIEHQHLIEQPILDMLLKLLMNFTKNPPQLMQVELHINLESGNDMNYYWHLFKLVRVNQQYIAEQIENLVASDNVDFDQRVSFQWQSVHEDTEDQIVSFTEQDVKRLMALLNEEYVKQELSGK